MGEFRKGSHTVYDIMWYGQQNIYRVIREKIAERLRDLIRQGCVAKNITIIRGSVGKDHVHLLVSCPLTLVVSKLMQF